MAGGLNKPMPIYTLRVSLQTVLQVGYCQITRPYLIRRLLLQVRYELDLEVGAHNNVLVTCFAIDKAWDIVVDWLESLDIVAAFDALDT